MAMVPLGEPAKRVLVVEDEKALAKALAMKLGAAGLSTEVAYDGREAVGMLSSEVFDLVLLDLILPRMDGFAVLKWIRERKKPQRVAILSNLGEEADIAKVKGMGVTDYFVKTDIKLSDVAKRVEELVKG